MAVTTGLVAAVGLGVAVPLSLSQSSSRELEGSSAAEALHGPWKLPAPSEAVKMEVRVSPSAAPRPPGKPTVEARTVVGPWRARISGRRLVLRNPATDATVVQRIDFVSPGKFLVQESRSEGSAGFGCTANGEYSWQLENEELSVAAIDDPCTDRAAVLEAGIWITPPPGGVPPTADPETSESPTSPDDETTPDLPSSEPSPEEPSPSPAPSEPAAQQ
jgi:hypothetical protein